jgi:hypothetical protein
MGFLKKIFKPVSKVLDKIVPNEIKPLLPYAAAFAPMLAPGIMGSSVLSRAAMGGGLNIFGQLAQEGNEGDINLLSAGLGALSGAMSAPGQSPTVGQGVPGADFTGADFGFEVAGNTAASGTPSAGEFFRNLSKGAEGSGVMASGQRFLGDTLAKGSDMYAAGLKEGLFSKAGLKAAALPAATATGDLMFAQAKRDQDAYEDAMAAEAEEEGASDASRAFAIRQSMEAYGFSEQEILDAISAAGYAYGGRVGFTKGGDVMKAVERGIDPAEALDLLEEFKKMKEKYGYEMSFDNYLDGEMFAKGGRVGLEFGGIPAALENIEDDEMKDTAKFVSAMDDMDIPIMDIVEEFEIQFKRKPNSLEEIKEFYKDRYDYKGPADVKIRETMEESFREKAAEGGLMDLGGKEMDLRGGGFVPIGKKEKADDVPARLSKNEFVMTADAVRAAGGGSVNEGAKRMYKAMNELEARA